MRGRVMALWLGVVMGVGLGQTLPGGAGMRAGGKWEGVVGRLSSEDFKVREGAQKELAGATWKDLGGLKELAGKAEDAEVKERVGQRVTELERELAVDPPPISVDWKDASLEEVCGSLARETGLAWSWGGSPQEKHFTLKAVERPLWEVFMGLNAQRPLEVMGYGNIHMQSTSGLGVEQGLVKGAFLIYPIELSRRVALQGKDAGRPEFYFRFGVMGDPRLKLGEVHQPVVMLVADEAGMKLFERKEASPERVSAHEMLNVEGAQAFAPAAGMGKKLTVSGEVRAAVVMEEDRVEVADLAKVGNVAIAVGPKRAVRFTHVLVNAERVELNVEVENTETGRDRQDDRIPMSIRVVDAADKPVWQANPTWGSMGGMVDVRGAKLPLKAVMGAAKEMKEVVVPFEFKDLVVP